MKEKYPKYTKLQQQCTKNPHLFSIALNIFLSKASEALHKEPFEPKDLPGDTFAPDTRVEIAGLVNSLGDTEPNVLLAAIKRDIEYPAPGEDIPPLHPYGDEENICPVCGAEVESNWDYQLDENSGMNYSWICPGCGATGKSGYNEVFDLHYEVRDKNGKAIPGRELHED